MLRAVIQSRNSPAHATIARPESTHDRATVHMCEHHVNVLRCMIRCAWLKAGRLRTDPKQEQQGQRERRRVQPPSFSHAGRSAARPKQNEGAQHSSAVQSFCTGSSTGSGRHLSPLPVEEAGCMACDAEARHEPSRSVCSISRKSKRFPWALFICRCNASVKVRFASRFL